MPNTYTNHHWAAVRGIPLDTCFVCLEEKQLYVMDLTGIDGDYSLVPFADLQVSVSPREQVSYITKGNL